MRRFDYSVYYFVLLHGKASGRAAGDIKLHLGEEPRQVVVDKVVADLKEPAVHIIQRDRLR